MREDILAELENEYETLRNKNEKEESLRREKIRRDYPRIEQLIQERENLVFGTIRQILDGNASADNLQDRMLSLNRKIETMLCETGLPKDYLDPVFHCPECRDTGYIGNPVREPCDCLKKAYQKKLRSRIGLGSNRAETFETYDASIIPDEPVNGTGITQRQLSAIARDQCKNWADQYPGVSKRDILLTGGSGTGKTFLLHAMAARLIERGQNVLIVSAYTFFQMARKSYFESENGVRELMDVPVLMLDDLGSEPLMQNITIEQLFFLINERQLHGLSTVISSNLTLQELRERYTERIVSRLNSPRTCLVLTLAGRDLRKIER